MRYPINKVLTMRKPHACGSKEWQVVRAGAEIGLKCLGCSREIMLLPSQIDKRIKKTV